MAAEVTWIDRLRIERVVWSLDQRLYDLPRRSRIATRREVRQNLLSAAEDIGTRPALGRLGTSSELAREYLDAELGRGPHHSWIVAALVAGAFPLFFMSVSADVAAAFRQGLLASNPEASGTFSTHGISGLQTDITFHLTRGAGDYVGGAMTPLCWLLMAALAVLAGRLWLIPKAWWRRTSNARSEGLEPPTF